MQILAFNQMELGRKDFEAMPPHMQTELVLLGIERGRNPLAIANALGVHVFEILKIARARHLHNLPTLSVSGFDDKPAPEREMEKRPVRIEIDGLELSRSQIAVLRWIAGGKNGKVSALRVNMAEAVKLSVRSLDTALIKLLDTGLVSRLRVASKSKPALWTVTAAGHALLATLEQGEAA